MKLIVIRFRCASEANRIECVSDAHRSRSHGTTGKPDSKQIVASVGVIHNSKTIQYIVKKNLHQLTRTMLEGCVLRPVLLM